MVPTFLPCWSSNLIPLPSPQKPASAPVGSVELCAIGVITIVLPATKSSVLTVKDHVAPSRWKYSAPSVSDAGWSAVVLPRNNLIEALTAFTVTGCERRSGLSREVAASVGVSLVVTASAELAVCACNVYV